MYSDRVSYREYSERRIQVQVQGHLWKLQSCGLQCLLLLHNRTSILSCCYLFRVACLTFFHSSLHYDFNDFDGFARTQSRKSVCFCVEFCFIHYCSFLVLGRHHTNTGRLLSVTTFCARFRLSLLLCPRISSSSILQGRNPKNIVLSTQLSSSFPWLLRCAILVPPLPISNGLRPEKGALCTIRPPPPPPRLRYHPPNPYCPPPRALAPSLFGEIWSAELVSRAEQYRPIFCCLWWPILTGLYSWSPRRLSITQVRVCGTMTVPFLEFESA
jgi:hypothetical protein